MKMLMMYATRFAYKTTTKTLDSVPDMDENQTIEDALIGFIQVEADDEERLTSLETKLVKNLKWAARKNATHTIVLHSFAHLSESKASPENSAELLKRAEQRLYQAGYQSYHTPFGYFLDLDIQAPGTSTARIFKSL